MLKAFMMMRWWSPSWGGRTEEAWRNIPTKRNLIAAMINEMGRSRDLMDCQKVRRPLIPLHHWVQFAFIVLCGWDHKRASKLRLVSNGKFQGESCCYTLYTYHKSIRPSLFGYPTDIFPRTTINSCGLKYNGHWMTCSSQAVSTRTDWMATDWLTDWPLDLLLYRALTFLSIIESSDHSWYPFDVYVIGTLNGHTHLGTSVFGPKHSPRELIEK